MREIDCDDEEQENSEDRVRDELLTLHTFMKCLKLGVTIG